MNHAPRPAGITALAFFFLFGTTAAAIAAVTLAVPGSALETLWRLNPRGRAGLGSLGTPIAGAIIYYLASARVRRYFWAGDFE